MTLTAHTDAQSTLYHVRGFARTGDGNLAPLALITDSLHDVKDIFESVDSIKETAEGGEEEK